MKVLIQPKPLKGTVFVPPSKSQAHRAIIAASLSKGKSVISNIEYSEDIVATIGAMEKIGAKFIRNTAHLIVSGVSKVSISDDNFIECNESGSTLRFVLPILSLSKEKVVFTGKRSLIQRPMNIYEDMFRRLNLAFIRNDDSIIINGSLTSGTYDVPGNVSSQFFSGLLFSLPLVKGDSKINIVGKLESKQYIDMTIDVVRQFGIMIDETAYGYFVRGGQSYHPCNITVEGDYSQMAFFAVASALNGDIVCRGVPLVSKQPDRLITDYMSKMNCDFTFHDNSIHFHKSSPIAAEIDVSQCPDIAPILAILASLSQGTTLISGAARLKIKESNRLQSVYDTLIKFGVQAELGDDFLKIQGRTDLNGGIFDSFNDHRIVMSVAIASVRANHPVIIKNAEAVNKSYPSFFEVLEHLGADITYIEE